MFKRLTNNRVDMAQFTPLPAGGVLVGGALRDALLGRAFNDLDWLVPDPERAARAAAETLQGSVFPLDVARGHWRVVSGEDDEEVRDYIRLDSDLETNLRGRDFTVNALAATADGALHDPLSGRADLRRKRLRMVSLQAFQNDPLRALRGVRLGTELGFELERETKVALEACVRAQLGGTLPLPASERVRDELDKIISSPRAGYGFQTLREVGLLELYLPELAKADGVTQGGYHHLDVLGHSLEALNQLVQGFPDAGLPLRWATLLHDIGKPDTKTYDETGAYYHFYSHDQLGADLTQNVLTHLRQPAALVKHAAGLVRYHMVQLPKTQKAARRFVHRRRELLPDLLRIMIADREAARGPMSSEASRQSYRLAMARIVEMLEATPPPSPPLLSGREVMTLLGLSEGPRVGEVVRFLKEAEAVGDVTNRAEAERVLRRYAAKQGWTET